MFRNILVPTDGSDLSKRAVEHGIALAKLTGGKITALHVYPRYSGSPYGNFGPPEDVLEEAYIKQSKASATKIFGQVKKLATAAGVDADTKHAENNDVYKQIIATAKAQKCDLICMASHGRRGLSGVVLGSETQKVLTHTATPVLVLR